MIRPLYYFSIVSTLTSVADLAGTLFVENYILTHTGSRTAQWSLLGASVLGMFVIAKLDLDHPSIRKLMFTFWVSMSLECTLLLIFPVSVIARVLENLLGIGVGLFIFFGVRRIRREAKYGKNFCS